MRPARARWSRATCSRRSRPARGGPDLRLVGRRADAPRTTASSSCRTRPGLRGAGADRRARRSTSAPARRRSCRSCARPAATSSASTGACRSTRPGQRIGHDRAVQGNLDPTLLLGPRDRLLARRRRRAARGPAGGPATSSTSVTASCPPRLSSTSRRSRASCTGTASPVDASRVRRRRSARRRCRRGRGRTRRTDPGARRPAPRPLARWCSKPARASAV